MIPASRSAPRGATTWAVSIRSSLLSPTALGGPSDYIGEDNYWETVFSIGLVPLVLAAVAVARHPDRRLIRGWLLLAGLAIAFACGRSLGLYSFMYSFAPGMKWFRVPARSLFLANLSGSVLAGLGVETLRRWMTTPRAWRSFARTLVVFAVFVVGVLFLVQLRRIPDEPSGRLHDGVALTVPVAPPTSHRTARAASRVLHDGGFWLALLSLSSLALMGCRPGNHRRLLGSLVGLVAMAELGWSGFSLLQVAPAGQFMGPDPVSAELRNGIMARSVPSDRYGSIETRRADATGLAELPPRIKARDSYYGDLTAIVHGIEKTNVNDAFQLDHAASLYETLYPVASRVRPMAELLLTPSAKVEWRRIRQAVFDRMGVTHIVSDRVESDPGWPIAADGTWDGSRFVIQRNPTAMPRAYVVPRVTLLPDHDGVVLTSLTDLDPHATVIMSDDPLGSISFGPRQPFTIAEWTSNDPDRPAVVVTTRAPGLLVVADSWMPGWTANVDGRPAPVLRGNGAQRVIPLPEPGSHSVFMQYRPPGLSAGCIITILSILAWAVMVMARSRTGGLMRPGGLVVNQELPRPCLGSNVMDGSRIG